MPSIIFNLENKEEIKHMVLSCVKEDFISYVKSLGVDPFNTDICIDIFQLKFGVMFRTYIVVEGKETEYVVFKLEELPGCCKYLVSTGTYISPALRGKGLSYKLQQLKNKIAVLCGYTKLMCTVTEENIRELNVLHKSGWECIDEGVNKRTNNNVLLFIKNVDYSE